MRTILIQKEEAVLRQLTEVMNQYPFIQVVGAFTQSLRALEYAKKNPVDFALLDVELQGMNGLELGSELRKCTPEMILIYVTEQRQYVGEAILDVKADYYLTGPSSPEEIRELAQRAHLLSRRLEGNKIEVHTFGRFKVCFHHEPVVFRNAKAKELLALCVDSQGDILTMEQCVDSLWWDRPYDTRVKNLYRKAVAYLHRCFNDLGAGEVFLSGRGYCRVNMDKIDCDYTRYLQGEAVRYHGEYMIDYDWAREKEMFLLNNVKVTL